MSKIKAVIFDAGGVLIEAHRKERWKETNDLLGFRGKRKRMPSKKELKLFEKGKISFKRFLEKIFGKVSTKEYSKIKRTWEQANKLKPGSFSLAKKLKKRCKLALLSNTSKIHVDYNRKVGNYAPFKIQVMSNEVGILKPEKEIYRMVLKRLGCKPEETAFFDDKRENVRAAKKMGIHAFLFKGPKQMEKQLEKIGAL